MRERDWFDIRRASLNERSWTSLPSEVISGCHRHSSLHPASLPSASHPPSSAPPYHRHGHATTNVIPFLSLFPVARYPVARCPLHVARFSALILPPFDAALRHLPRLSVTGYDLPSAVSRSCSFTRPLFYRRSRWHCARLISRSARSWSERL